MIKLENISFDHCIKCTVCTIYCPVARATHHFPGPKQSGPDTERLRIKSPELLDDSLKYCTNCKRCETACPSDVKIADIIQEAKWHYGEHHFNLRNFLFVPSGELHILDLDKAHRHRPPVPDAARRRNLARLERSLRKLGRAAPARDVEAVAGALHAAYRTAYA